MNSWHAMFDAEWYLAHNPDVAMAVAQNGMDPLEHFQRFGNAEGRSPGPLFNMQDYLRDNPDVALAVESGEMTAFDHFAAFGAAEGRRPTALFDEAFYLSQNPDVAAAVNDGSINAVQHFLVYGQGEPRYINPAIDLGAYLQANPDLAEAAQAGGISPMHHLMLHGVYEGRELGNGLSLGDFANDPKFAQALAQGDAEAALQRVSDVAPFMPGFIVPPGWAPDANTPIPIDFIPVSGMRLLVPAGVVVPNGMVLPNTFVPIAPPAEFIQYGNEIVLTQMADEPGQNGLVPATEYDDVFDAKVPGALDNHEEPVVDDFPWRAQDVLDGKGGVDTLVATLSAIPKLNGIPVPAAPDGIEDPMEAELMRLAAALESAEAIQFPADLYIASPVLKNIEKVDLTIDGIGVLDLTRSDMPDGAAITVTSGVEPPLMGWLKDQINTLELTPPLESLSLFALAGAPISTSIGFEKFQGLAALLYDMNAISSETELSLSVSDTAAVIEVLQMPMSEMGTSPVREIKTLNLESTGSTVNYISLSPLSSLLGLPAEIAPSFGTIKITGEADLYLNTAAYFTQDPAQIVNVDGSGASGDLHLYGGAGADTLIGGVGDDHFRGGADNGEESAEIALPLDGQSLPYLVDATLLDQFEESLTTPYFGTEMTWGPVGSIPETGDTIFRLQNPSDSGFSHFALEGDVRGIELAPGQAFFVNAGTYDGVLAVTPVPAESGGASGPTLSARRTDSSDILSVHVSISGGDTLTGGGGADVFEHRRGDGFDVITDFEVALDQLDMGGDFFTVQIVYGGETSLFVGHQEGSEYLTDSGVILSGVLATDFLSAPVIA